MSKTSRKWDKFRFLVSGAVLYSHLLRNSTLYCFSQIHEWIWSHVSLVLCTIHSHSQKTKSTKNGKDSMSLPFFQSLRVQQVAPTVLPPGSVGASALKCRGLHRRPAPFTREAKKFIYFIWCVLAALSKSYLFLFWVSSIPLRILRTSASAL